MTARSIISSAAVLLATATAFGQQPAAPSPGPLEFIAQPFDVLSYDAQLDLTKAPSKEMSGICDIRVRWSGEPSAFHFHLRGLVVRSATYDGAPVDVVPVETPLSANFHFDITPPSTVEMGDTSTIRIVYGGTMTGEVWGGVQSNSGTLYAMGVGFRNNYVSTTQHWLPCFDHPSDKATFRGRFRVKNGMTVASNGILRSTTPVDDSTVVFDWEHAIAASTYLLTFAVDRYLPVDVGNGALPMTIYSRAEDTAATRASFRLLPRMVESFGERFLPYPFEKVGYVNTPTGAMEHQTMVSFPTFLSQSRDSINSTGAHELAHQWFGDLVTCEDFRHAWLNESFAVFCETLWAEELGGFTGYLASQEAERAKYINTVARAEGVLPLYDFPRANPSSNYPTTIYAKGAVVVGMLRYEMGDSVFFAAIKDYLQRYAYGVATTEKLRDVLEVHAGRSLGWFFDQWVIGKGWPQVKVAVTKLNNDRVAVQLDQTQPSEHGFYTNLPVEIGFVGSQGTSYRMVRMKEQGERFELDGIGDFTSVTVNKGPSIRTLMTVSSVAGVAVAPADSGDIRITVRPNPSSSDIVTVNVDGTDDCKGIRYELYDTSGRRLLVGFNEICEFTIPTAGIGSGAYVLRFKLHDVYYDVPLAITR